MVEAWWSLRTDTVVFNAVGTNHYKVDEGFAWKGRTGQCLMRLVIAGFAGVAG